MPSDQCLLDNGAGPDALSYQTCEAEESGEDGVRFSVLMQPVNEPDFEGYYYAHIPSLDLTTHGLGIEGALKAAQELAEAWLAEKRAHGEAIPTERNPVIAQIEVADALLRP